MNLLLYDLLQLTLAFECTKNETILTIDRFLLESNKTVFIHLVIVFNWKSLCNQFVNKFENVHSLMFTIFEKWRFITVHSLNIRVIYWEIIYQQLTYAKKMIPHCQMIRLLDGTKIVIKIMNETLSFNYWVHICKRIVDFLNYWSTVSSSIIRTWYNIFYRIQFSLSLFIKALCFFTMKISVN